MVDTTKEKDLEDTEEQESRVKAIRFLTDNLNDEDKAEIEDWEKLRAEAFKVFSRNVDNADQRKQIR